MRERTIERYLHEQVTATGGTTRKFKGRINDLDRVVIFKGTPARVHFVELKATGKRPRPGQQRELTRLFELGCFVSVLASKYDVDRFVMLFK